LGEILKEKFVEDEAHERAMQDFFSRPPWLLPDEPPRQDGKRWPSREEIYDRECLK
jgi:hypothetical protein